ncbi:MAG: aminopeptidase N [Gammaproteobacteria bacterium]|nr:MAG: aminopeptidase N [Gammaproteobacteria bacterium]
MHDPIPSAIYLKDYRQPDYLIDTVDLEFNLQPGLTNVHSRMQVRRRAGVAESTALVLNGQELELISVIVNDTPRDISSLLVTDDELTLTSLPDQFVVEIICTIQPELNTKLEGLYKSGSMYCTQCEAEGFRRITYFPDRPDIMARFSARIFADKTNYPVLLSNGNLVDSGDSDGNRHWVYWEDPYPKPCYLFALVAGPLSVLEDSYRTISGRDVALKLYTEPHNSSKTDHAMRSLKQAMHWDEEVFGLEYDLNCFMIVAVDDFNMGAMENKGLNIFNTACVLARPDTATDADYDRIQSIVGHEYFHNWTGNRVTCRDWFQLSLKEGLTVFRDQEFSADLNSRAVKRIEEVRVLRCHQFPEDDGPTAHPVRPDNYIEISNFYTSTIYRKGAEVIRMMHTLIGADAFRRGMDLYFQRHDGQAVTTDDFVKVMEDASKQDLGQFRLWYSQAGTPELEISTQFNEEKAELRLEIRQHTPDTPGQSNKLALHIPFSIGLLDEDGNDIAVQLSCEDDAPAAGTQTLGIRKHRETFIFKTGNRQPRLSLLRNFSAPVRITSKRTLEELCFLLRHDSDPFNRWEAGQQLAMGQIQALIADINYQVPDIIFGAFAEIIGNPTLDQALIAEIFTLPGESYLADNMETVDVEGIHRASRRFTELLAQRLENQLSAIADGNEINKTYSFNAKDVARRRLHNLSLSFLMELPDSKYLELCLNHYQQADNMTDSLSALITLSNRDCDASNQALESFYKKWSAEVLVVNKWLSVQAMSRLPGTLDKVRQLTKHDAFDIRNPNKVRALIGCFCGVNQAQFHAANGNGYAFLTSHVIEIDPLNPQIAARLLTPLTRWRRMDSERQSLMKQALETILAQQGLSRDVFEIASKSLA